MRYLILLLISIVSLPVYAIKASDDSRICAPFRGGVVDPVIVESMLQAADENRLYRIQANNSRVGFCVDSAIGRVEAQFKGIQGGMALSREIWGSESQILVMVDTNSLAMDECFVKKMLTSESFLDTYMYPRILFVSTGIRWLDREKAVLDGLLSMHGVTRPIRFDVKMALLKTRDPQNVADIIVTAKSFINRADFEMGRLGFLVNDTVELCMRIEASLFTKHDH